MASRFNSQNLHQRDPRSALFSGYTPSSSSRTSSPNPSAAGAPGAGGGGGGGGRTGVASAPGGGYGYGSGGPGVPSYSASSGLGVERTGSGFRPGTPNRKGQYSDAVLNELESQNDAQVEGILGKVKILKEMTVQIGDEIRESSALAEKMNDAFDETRLKMKKTMTRMLIMAERTGVGWKVWLAFFALVIFIFTYVWLF